MQDLNLRELSLPVYKTGAVGRLANLALWYPRKDLNPQPWG